LGRVASMKWEREEWVKEYGAGESISEIARRHGISRKAVHKWIHRYEEYGVEGLEDLSRAPRDHPNAVQAIWQERVAAERRAHPRWGAPKLAWVLQQKHPPEGVPSASTIGRILKDQGLSRGPRARPARAIGRLSEAQLPNDVWCIDFKGWRRTGDGQCCQPLTVTDQTSRYLLCCQALGSTRTELVKPVLERVFREYGLPQRMRSDNGPPFGDGGACGLTELAAWWIELGIECERIQRGCPQQNGRHERMHRTLGEETMNPPANTLRKQQKRFHEFQRHYNHERPHQALGQRVPAEFYEVSSREFPERTPEPNYGPNWERRQVGGRGQMKWGGERYFISHALSGKQIGFEPVGEMWRVWFYHHWLGLWDEKRKKLLRPHSLRSEVASKDPLNSPAGSSGL
jgi:putative transposase